MPKRTLSLGSGAGTYPALRQAVEETLLAGQRKIERDKLEVYWTTGRHIHEHLLHHEDRADYGDEVIPRLGHDIKVSDRVLYRCLHFFRAYPIPAALPELLWAHFCALLRLEDRDLRARLAAQAVKSGWTSRRLEERVSEVQASLAPDQAAPEEAPAVANVERLKPKCGTPGLHLIVDRGEGPAVDLGFNLYQPLASDQLRRFEPGAIVRLGDSRITRAEGAAKTDLFTYSATITRVVDGDTLVIVVEVAAGIFLELKLRLRGIDCPEMSTAEGKDAKRFVDGLVASASEVTVTTTKPDKYDRYLADVFLTSKEGESVFLNNVLLANGHAVAKDSWEFGDWEKELLR